DGAEHACPLREGPLGPRRLRLARPRDGGGDGLAVGDLVLLDGRPGRGAADGDRPSRGGLGERHTVGHRGLLSAATIEPLPPPINAPPRRPPRSPRRRGRARPPAGWPPSGRRGSRPPR